MAKINRKTMNAELSSALFDDFERFEMFVAAYWKTIVGVAIALVILVSAGFWIITSRRAAERRAAHALADASTEAELVSALEKYADSTGAPIARFRLARHLFDAKKYDEAKKQFSWLALNAPGEILRGDAVLALAYLAELSGDFKAAAAEFDKIGADMKFSAGVRAEANYNAGRLLIREKDLKGAEVVLSRGSEAQSLWSQQAKVLLAGVRSGDFGKVK